MKKPELPLMLAIALCAIGAIGMIADAHAQVAPYVRISQGKVTGVTQPDGVRAFLGIPYARPPIGALRWRPSQSAPAWSGTLVADHFSAGCASGVRVQVPAGAVPRDLYTPEYNGRRGASSEDCLYLNVWTPTSSATKPKGVLVWFHGGAFIGGSTAVPIYDGRRLAAKGIVVVSVNYRLGALGFLATQDLASENSGAGNFGLLDMITALKWVQENIRAFGGDPARVTIAGQSAGSAAVVYLLGAPSAHRLFARGIAESGAVGSIIPLGKAEAERRGAEYLAKAGVQSVAQARQLPLASLTAIEMPFPHRGSAYAPVQDGVVLPVDPLTAVNKGLAADVALLAGGNADEDRAIKTLADYRALLVDRHGDFADEVMKAFPASDDSGTPSASKQMFRSIWVDTLRRWGAARAAHGSAPTYLYFYTHAEPGSADPEYGAFHSSEIPYVFKTLDAAPERPFTDLDRSISDQMATYWANFVNTGNPNDKSSPPWPKFDPSRPALMELGDQFAPFGVDRFPKAGVFSTYLERAR